MNNTVLSIKMCPPLMVVIDFWDKTVNDYALFYIAVDTGAHMTCIDRDTLVRAGYDVTSGAQRQITTASGTEYVTEVYIDRIKLGNIELENVLEALGWYKRRHELHADWDDIVTPAYARLEEACIACGSTIDTADLLRHRLRFLKTEKPDYDDMLDLITDKHQKFRSLMEQWAESDEELAAIRRAV